MTVLFTACNEQRLHLINDGFLLFSHGFTQCIALPTGKIGQLSRQQHHLLLIYGDTVCVLQILLHARNVVRYQRRIVLASDKFRNIIHRSGAVKCVHSDEVFKHRRMQFL